MTALGVSEGGLLGLDIVTLVGLDKLALVGLGTVTLEAASPCAPPASTSLSNSPLPRPLPLPRPRPLGIPLHWLASQLLCSTVGMYCLSAPVVNPLRAVPAHLNCAAPALALSLYCTVSLYDTAVSQYCTVRQCRLYCTMQQAHFLSTTPPCAVPTPPVPHCLSLRLSPWCVPVRVSGARALCLSSCLCLYYYLPRSFFETPASSPRPAYSPQSSLGETLSLALHPRPRSKLGPLKTCDLALADELGLYLC